MNHENIITWNVTNWITIFLMAFLGFALLALAARFWKDRKGGTQNGA